MEHYAQWMQDNFERIEDDWTDVEEMQEAYEDETGRRVPDELRVIVDPPVPLGEGVIEFEMHGGKCIYLQIFKGGGVGLRLCDRSGKANMSGHICKINYDGTLTLCSGIHGEGSGALELDDRGRIEVG